MVVSLGSPFHSGELPATRYVLEPSHSDQFLEVILELMIFCLHLVNYTVSPWPTLQVQSVDLLSLSSHAFGASIDFISDCH